MRAHGPIVAVAQLQHRVGEKRQQNQARQNRGQMLLAVAIVVLEAVAFGLERIVVLVLDLPAAAPGGHESNDRVGVDRLRAGPGVAIGHVARGIGGLKKPSENFLCRSGNRIFDDYEHDNDNGQGLRPSLLVPALPG